MQKGVKGGRIVDVGPQDAYSKSPLVESVWSTVPVPGGMKCLYDMLAQPAMIESAR